MTIQEKISQAYKESGSYPELVDKLIGAGVLNYTVDVGTGTTLFRFSDGAHVLVRGHSVKRETADQFSKPLTIQAVKNTQRGKTTYPEFMDEIARAGVRIYEATLQGQKRVTYIGAQDEYEEEISSFDQE